MGFAVAFCYCADSNRKLICLIAYIWIVAHVCIANCAGLASGRSHLGFVALIWLGVSDVPPILRRVVDGRSDPPRVAHLAPFVDVIFALLCLFLWFICSIFRSVVKCRGWCMHWLLRPPPHPQFTILTFVKAWSATRYTRCGRCLFAPPSKGGASLCI